jgi:hypothetical protein
MAESIALKATDWSSGERDPEHHRSKGKMLCAWEGQAHLHRSHHRPRLDGASRRTRRANRTACRPGTLKNCAFASCLLRTASQARLFATFTPFPIDVIDADDSARRPEDLLDLLLQSPHIVHHVRSLRVNLSTGFSRNSSPPCALRQESCPSFATQHAWSCAQPVGIPTQRQVSWLDPGRDSPARSLPRPGAWSNSAH